MRWLSMMIVLLALLCACGGNECLDNTSSLPLAGFYSSEPTPQAIYVDSLTIYGIGAPGNQMLEDSAARLNQVYLPFRIDRGRTDYVIRYLQREISDSRLYDTISFRYDIEPRFVSAACGAVYDFRIKEILHTRHFIDSVTCPLGYIDNAPKENLRIYFRVAYPEERKGVDI